MNQYMLIVSFQEKNSWPWRKLQRRKPPEEKDDKPGGGARGQSVQNNQLVQRCFGRGESEKIFPAAGDPSEIWLECIKPSVHENEHSQVKSKEIQSPAKHPKKGNSLTGCCVAHCERSEEKSQSSAYDSASKQLHQDRRWKNLESD